MNKVNIKTIMSAMMKKYLTILKIPHPEKNKGLKPIPCHKVIRDAYKFQLQSHPDKGGSTENFQSITEAFRELLKYSLENPEKVQNTPDLEEQDDRKLLEKFETESKVKYNETSVTVFIEEKQAKEWIESLKTYFKEQSKDVQNGVLFKDDTWRIPGSTLEPKSVSVTVYPTSGAGSKLLVQGSYYLQFVTHILPKIATTLGKPPPDIARILSEEDVTEKEKVKTSEDPSKQSKEPTKDMAEKDIILEEGEEAAVNIVDPNSAGQAIQRIETSFINHFKLLDNRLKSSIDKQMKAETKIDALTTEVTALKEKLADPIKEEHIEKIISNIETVQTKVGTSTTEIKTKIEEVKSSVKVVDGKLIKVSKDFDEFMSDVKEETVLDKMKTMLEKVSKLEAHLAKLTKLYSTKASTTEPEPVKVDEKLKVRKGIVFTDSTGENIDKERIEKATSSEIKIVKTVRILNNPKDPESFLKKAVEENMTGEEYAFAAFMVGTNDTKDLKDNNELDQPDVIEKCEKQSQCLVESAVAFSNEFGAESFILERIPRFDSVEEDEVGALEALNAVANAHLVTKVASARALKHKVHLVRHPNFNRPRTKEELYTEKGIHLNTKGLYNLSTNLIKAVQSVFTDLKVLEVHEPRPPPPKQRDPSPRLAPTPNTSTPPPGYRAHSGSLLPPTKTPPVNNPTKQQKQGYLKKTHQSHDPTPGAGWQRVLQSEQGAPRRGGQQEQTYHNNQYWGQQWPPSQQYWGQGLEQQQQGYHGQGWDGQYNYQNGMYYA